MLRAVSNSVTDTQGRTSSMRLISYVLVGVAIVLAFNDALMSWFDHDQSNWELVVAFLTAGVGGKVGQKGFEVQGEKVAAAQQSEG